MIVSGGPTAWRSHDGACLGHPPCLTIGGGRGLSACEGDCCCCMTSSYPSAANQRWLKKSSPHMRVIHSTQTSNTLLLHNEMHRQRACGNYLPAFFGHHLYRQHHYVFHLADSQATQKCSLNNLVLALVDIRSRFHNPVLWLYLRKENTENYIRIRLPEERCELRHRRQEEDLDSEKKQAYQMIPVVHLCGGHEALLLQPVQGSQDPLNSLLCGLCLLHSCLGLRCFQDAGKTHKGQIPAMHGDGWQMGPNSKQQSCHSLLVPPM